jgi:hypothetical protein
MTKPPEKYPIPTEHNAWELMYEDRSLHEGRSLHEMMQTLIWPEYGEVYYETHEHRGRTFLIAYIARVSPTVEDHVWCLMLVGTLSGDWFYWYSMSDDAAPAFAVAPNVILDRLKEPTYYNAEHWQAWCREINAHQAKFS